MIELNVSLWAGDMAQAAKHLPRKPKDLSSNPGTTKKSISISICLDIYIYMCVYIYIYIYI
jgi:hypothetical protein